ncbi:hypothetical protein BJX96DRAFT_186602 [Aspergillus floccosus]
MPLGTISSLSIEILHEIFSYSCLHCCGEHQSALPHAHRRETPQEPDALSWHSLERFCSIAQPILYHEFVPGYGDSWRSTLYSWNGRLPSFVRTVARRRDLAARVRRIYLHPYLLPSNDVEERKDAVRQAAKALQIEEPKSLVSDDLLALLIALLPNLNHCSLQSSERRVQAFYASALRKARVSSLPLRTLDVVLHANTYAYEFLNLGWRVGALLDVATHLQTLNLHMCDGIWTKPPFPSLPNLKTIRITHSRLSKKDLEGLLLSCNGLRSFTYETCGPYVPRLLFPHGNEHIDHFRPSDAVLCLRRHRETLESLHLDLRKRGVFPMASGGIYYDRPEPIMDFRNFSALQHLFLSASEFYDSTYKEPPPLTELLPRSIATLQFASDMRCSVKWLSNGILGLAGAISEGHFPDLKKVTCDTENTLDNELMVGAMFAGSGVEFGYDSWPASEATLNLPGDLTPMSSFFGSDCRWDTMEQLPLPDEDDPDL